MRKLLFWSLLPLTLCGQGVVNTQQTFQANPILSRTKSAATLGTDSNGQIIAGAGGSSTGNILIASQISGVHLDATLGTPGSPGSGTQTCTGNAAKFITAMTTVLATFNAVELDLDGPSCIEEALLVPSGNVTIRGIGNGAGFMPMAGCDCMAITSALHNPSGSAPSQVGSVSVQDLSINGNLSSNAGSGQNCGTFSPTVNSCYAIQLINLLSARVSHVTIFNYPSFGVVLANNGENILDDSFISGPSALGSDPIHIEGPNSKILVRGNVLAAGDDCVGVDAPEGYGGNLSDLVFLGNEMQSCPDFMRIYSYISPNYFSVHGVIVDGLTGTVTGGDVFTFDIGGEPNVDAKEVKIAHVYIKGAESLMLVKGYWQEISVSDTIIESTAWAYPGAIFGIDGIVSHLDVENVGFLRTNSNGVTSLFPIQVNGQYSGGAAVQNLHVHNLWIEDSYGSSVGAAPQFLDIINGGTVANLNLDGVLNPNGKITNLFSSGTAAQVTNVAGADNFEATPSASCGTATGTNTRGSIAITSNVSQCTLTMGGQVSANNGWSCNATQSGSTGTPASVPQTGGSKTTAVLGISGTTTLSSGNTLTYLCGSY